jgi:hypothetical protein
LLLSLHVAEMPHKLRKFSPYFIVSLKMDGIRLYRSAGDLESLTQDALRWLRHADRLRPSPRTLHIKKHFAYKLITAMSTSLIS